MILTLLILPLLLAAVLATMDLALYYQKAGHHHAIADLAALSGVQELDLDELGEGRRIFKPSAQSEARKMAQQNLHEMKERLGQERVDVYVLQTEGRSGTVRHPATGRRVQDPTVSVRIQARYQPKWLLRVIVRSLPIDVVADASVFPRRRWW